MGKRSQKRPRRKDQGGCVSSLMSIFDFRHGGSTRKLIAGKKRGIKQAEECFAASTGVESSTTGPTTRISNDNHGSTKEAEESESTKADTVKTSVKELMEEEMINEHGRQKQIDLVRVGSEEFDSEHGNCVRNHLKDRNQTSTKSIDELKVSDDVDVETIIEELCQIHHNSNDTMRNNLSNYADMQSDQDYNVVQEKLTAAIKVFMIHRLDHSKHTRKDGKFMDALETINSYQDLFLKLIQDPNSLLVKHIKGHEDSQLIRSNFSEDVIESNPGDPIDRKHLNFFRRRSKSQESYPLDSNKICQSSSKIVILKPGPASSRYPHNGNSMTTSLQSHDSMDNKVESEKIAPFSFAVIKRRLKHAMGKDRVDTEKVVGGENLGWSSPNRNHFYTERFAKPSIAFRRDMIGELKDDEATETTESSSYLKKGVSNLYVEAKKHLSEMLNNREANSELNRGKLPKSLGRILSLPEYKDFERYRPENDMEDSFGTARMRLSPCGTPRAVNDNLHELVHKKHDGYLSPSRRSLDIRTRMTEENYHEEGKSADVNNDSICGILCDNVVEETIPEGILGIDRRTKTTDQEEDNVVNVPEISITTTPTSNDIQNNNVALFNEETPFQLLQLRSLEEAQESSSPPATPSCSPADSNNEDPEKEIDRGDRPSPISVLEPLFSPQDISPSSTMDQRVKLKINPREIHFEEQRSSDSVQGICMTCADDGETPFDYVEAVLLGSDLNWDAYLLNWLSSDQILDPGLFDEVELFSSRPHDRKLLFDFTNGVLRDVCDRYFGSFIGISFKKQSKRPLPRGMNLINEIWDGVERHLLQHPTPNLDQLIKKDLTKSETWMELQLDFKHIAIKLEEAIFEELVEDSISSFVEDKVKNMVIVFPAEPDQTEISIDI